MYMCAMSCQSFLNCIMQVQSRVLSLHQLSSNLALKAWEFLACTTSSANSLRTSILLYRKLKFLTLLPHLVFFNLYSWPHLLALSLSTRSSLCTSFLALLLLINFTLSLVFQFCLLQSIQFSYCGCTKLLTIYAFSCT